MRSSPLCGVSVLHPAQYDLLDNNHGDRQKTKHKGYPGCLAHEVICHVLRRLCQPTPTPIYINVGRDKWGGGGVCCNWGRADFSRRITAVDGGVFRSDSGGDVVLNTNYTCRQTGLGVI